MFLVSLPYISELILVLQELMAVSTHLERTTDSTGCSASLAPNRRSNGTALEDQRPAHDATLNLSLCLETC